jgi:hypothetical protein
MDEVPRSNVDATGSSRQSIPPQQTQRQDDVFQTLVKMYHAGANTRYGTIGDLVERITEHNIDLIPNEFAKDVHEYVDQAPKVLQIGSWRGTPTQVMKAIRTEEQKIKQRLQHGVETYRFHRMR